jgi:hypothetical protein
MQAPSRTAGSWLLVGLVVDLSVGALRLTDSMPLIALALLLLASLVAMTWPLVATKLKLLQEAVGVVG